MNQKENAQSNISTRALYMWSIVCIIVGVGVGAVLFIRYQWTVTPCGDDGCKTLRDIVGVVQPLAMLIALVGMALFIRATVRYFGARCWR